MDCYNASKSNEKPLPLRVFVAGRNRLENEGTTALSKVFKVRSQFFALVIYQGGAERSSLTKDKSTESN